jgi:hypothetical protein
LGLVKGEPRKFIQNHHKRFREPFENDGLTTIGGVEARMIRLTKRQVAYVSPRVYREMMEHVWCAFWNKGTQSYYAVRKALCVDGKKRHIYMHRQILGLEPFNPMQGDHENHDTLNNTDKNLRRSTHAQNTMNRRAQKNRRNGHGLRGVQVQGSCSSAKITVDGKQIYLGSRKTPQAAHKLYCEGAKRYHGDFARTD